MSSEREKVDISSLNEDEQKMFLSTKMKMFKSTLVMCLIYAVIAILVLWACIFTKWGKENIYEKLQYFIITYIIGTLVIIIYTAYSVYSFQPTKYKEEHGYDAEMCPDYWILEEVNIDTKDVKDKLNPSANNININHFKYKCKMDPNIVDVITIKDVNGGLDNDLVTGSSYIKSLSDNVEKDSDMRKHSGIMSGYTQTPDDTTGSITYKHNVQDGTTIPEAPLACDQVYPMYLSMMDSEHAKKNPSNPKNYFRCKYSKICNIPWTDAGCSN